MNWRVLAKKDFLDSYRKWSLGTAAVAFVIFLTVPVYMGMSGNSTPGDADFFSAVGFVVFLVPLAALMMSYDAIAGERELGSLKLLLAQPYTRRDVVAGIAAGRAMVVGTATCIGIFVATVVFLAFDGGFSIASYIVFIVLVCLLAAAYSGAAVCFSAVSPTSNRAMATSVGFFMLTLIGWSSIPQLFRYVLNGFSTPRGGRPEWASFIDSLSPIQAYSTGIDTVVHSNGTVGSFYETGWFAILVLIAWAVIPVVFGYLKFNQTDL
ncbi:ABC transporter permease subunit [Haladaptatus cibarius]|uniref:ABC transporter permease subunit n=1 Tax=Haladaptatus cibarius TaxID=453847 RepID=UPI0006784373|nr:ABC transporter permease subunit [Haladaptatus cibarius]